MGSYGWLQGEGDTVVAKVLPNEPGKVVIEKIEGDGGRLGLDPATNCVGIAATETLKLVGQPSCGVSLTLHKVSASCQVLTGELVRQ
jgi:homoserine kinase